MPSYGTDLGGISDEEWLAGGMSASDFPLPESGTLGTLPRNAYYGPSYFTTDFSLFKNIAMRLFGSEAQTLQLRIEAYNLFDTLNLNNPVTNTAAVNFGVVTNLRTPGGGLPGSRLAQVGLKFLF